MTTPTVGNDVQPWLETIHQMAAMNKLIDGHLTIMAFTTGWKAMFGTPELSEAGRAELHMMTTWPTLEKALEIVYQDALGEIEYWNEDARLHDQPVSSAAQEIEQIKAKAFGAAIPTYTQLLNRLKDIMLAMRISEITDGDDDDILWPTLHSVRKDMINVPYTGIEHEIEAEAQRVLAADPDDNYWPTWMAATD